MNPFVYGRVVSSGDFCPRPRLSRMLEEFIRSRQNVLVQGERRTGKTSLIHETAGKMGSNVIYVDFLESRSVHDVVRRLVSGLVTLDSKAGILGRVLGAIAHLRPTFSVDPITGNPALSLDSAVKVRPETVEGILDAYEEIGAGTGMTVIFDEFQDILKLEDSGPVLAVMRGKIQFQQEVVYIFAGSVRNEMNGIFTDPESPFFKSAAVIEVDAIEHEAFGEFIREKFSSGDRTIRDEVLVEIYRIAEDIPGDVQQLCNALWDCSEPGDEITPDLLPAALELIFSREIRGYENALAKITGLQIRTLVSIARLGGEKPFSREFLESTGTVHVNALVKSLGRLEKLKILYRRKDRYVLVNPFFKAWLLHKGY